MWGTIIKYLFATLIIALVFIGLQSMGVVDAISTQTAHFAAVFNFLIGNIKNMSVIFPWVVDVAIMFTAVIAIELIMVTWKVGNFISKKFGH